MVKVKAIKESIEIKCKPIVPFDFKYKLLNKLSFNYILKSKGKRFNIFDKIHTLCYTDAEFLMR